MACLEWIVSTKFKKRHVTPYDNITYCLSYCWQSAYTEVFDFSCVSFNLEEERPTAIYLWVSKSIIRKGGENPEVTVVVHRWVRHFTVAALNRGIKMNLFQIFSPYLRKTLNYTSWWKCSTFQARPLHMKSLHCSNLSPKSKQKWYRQKPVIGIIEYWS